MCCEARSQAHLLSSIVLLAMSLAKLKRSACIVGNDIHVKKCSLHFCRVFQSAEGVVDTLGWTQRNSLPHPQKVTKNFCFASNFNCNNAALFPNVF